MTPRNAKTRSNGEGSVFKLSDGRYRATKTAGFTPEGKQKIISGSGPTRALALERRETAWTKWLVRSGQAPVEALGSKKLAQEASNKKVAEFFLEWHANLDRSRTKEHYRRQILTRIELHINPAFGKMPLYGITTENVQTWVRQTLPDKKKENGDALLSYGTIASIFRTFKLGMDEAVRKGLIPTNPAKDVRPPKRVTPTIDLERKKWVPQHLMSKVEGTEWECFYLLKMLYGLRISELLGLTDEAFTLTSKNPRMTVRNQLKRRDVSHGCGPRGSGGVYPCKQKTAGTCPKKVGNRGYYLDPPKTEAGVRTLPLVEPALSAVRAHMKAQKALRKKSGYAPSKGLETLIFTTPTGGPLRHTKANTMWHKLLEDAGVEYLRGHEMRHVTATLLAENGVGLEVTKLIMGHSQAVQSAYYTHVSASATKAPLENLGAQISQRMKRSKKEEAVEEK